MSEPVRIEQLVGQLAALGIRPGDLVMVHASLRAVGPVDGGADALITALDRAVGVEGTLLMVLGADDPQAWVNRRPQRERVALLADAEPFDAATTPAQPDVGVLAERFRRGLGSVVSDHPEGRFGARGRRAAELTADPPWHDYYGPGSPLDKLVRLGGKILRLGADLDTVTALHYAEYLAPLPAKRRVRRYRRVAGPDGPRVRYVDCLDDEHGIVDYPGEDYFAAIVSAYLATGRGARGRVGAARSELIDAADLVGFAVAWMAAKLC